MGIHISAVTKVIGDPPTQVLHGIDLEIRDGEFVALTGRSGSGKSTLLYVVSSLDRPTTGSVSYDGVDVAALPSFELHRFRNEKMGFVFQFHYLLPELTALENVLMPARKTHREKEILEHGKHLLDQFGLGDKMHRLPRQLSGGEQQRVAIARSLAMHPKYLFADEPTGALDSVNGERVIQIFRQVNREMKTTLVMVTHDVEFANLATRKVQLVDGRVVHAG